MKKTAIIIIILGIILGFYIGFYLYKINTIDDKIAKQGTNNNLNIMADNHNSKEEKLVNSSNIKITPNTNIIEKIYYKDCNHIITTTKKAENDLINLTEEAFRNKYKNKEIQKFTEEEIVIYEEKEEFCNEHYLLKENEGYVEIYLLDLKGNISKISERTEIATEFLPEEDRNKLKEGIKIYSKQELNKTIEDFE